MRRDKGFALVITLVIAALLTALVVEFIRETYVATAYERNLVNGQQASLLAESGIIGAAGLLVWTLKSRGDSSGYSSLQDEWAQEKTLENSGGTISFRVEEENGKLNLNDVVHADGNAADAYRRLLKRLELPLDLTDSLTDWTDADDLPRPGGAEKGYYETLRPPYVSRNKPLDTWGELGLVKGFTPEVRRKLRPFATVYGNGSPVMSPVNVNTAPPELLTALDDRITDDLAKRIVEYRKEAPFTGTGADLAKVPGMESIAPVLAGRITAKGSIYRIVSRGQIGETVRTIEAVVRINGMKPSFEYWREQ